MILRNGFASQLHFHGHGNGNGNCLLRCCSGSGIKANRWCAVVMCGMDVVSIAKPATPTLNLLSGSSREKESMLIPREMEDFEQKMPPWGDLAIPEEAEYMEVKHEAEGENVSESGNEYVCVERAGLNEDKVHFLEETDEGVLSERVLALCRMNKVRSALELFWSMELASLSPDLQACHSLISCLFRNGLVDDGLRVFEFMKRSEVGSGHTYSLVLKAVGNARGFDLALDMFMELAEDCKVKREIDAIVYIYNTMISLCGKSSNWVESGRVWRSMKDNGVAGTHITYGLLVSIFVRCGQNELALDAYTEMIQNGLKPRNDTMEAVISACTKEGKWDLALNVFESMLSAGFRPSLTACSALINSLGKAGKVKLAFRMYDVMKSIHHAPNEYTWNALLGALYHSNRVSDALQLFERIKREPGTHLNSHLFNTALLCCSKLGQWEKAVQLLWEMEASGLSVSTASYNHIIRACETARKPKVALQVYQRMVDQKYNPDNYTYLSLLRACIWGSLWNDVRKIMDTVAPNVSIYNAAIQGMCLKGNINSAKNLYMKMREAGLKPDGKLSLDKGGEGKINFLSLKLRMFNKRKTKNQILLCTVKHEELDGLYVVYIDLVLDQCSVK